MSIKVQGQVVITNDKKGQFEQVNPGAYTTAERDALTPAIGDIVFNSEADELQVWDGTEWGSTGSANGLIQPQVEVLTPLDRAGDPELTYLKSDTIVAVEDEGGLITHETDTISNVDSATATPNIILSFPTSNSFNKFAVGEVVQGWNYSSRSGYTGDATNAFDGDINTSTSAESKLTVNREFTGVTSLRVRFEITRGQTFTINGSVVTPDNWSGNENGTRNTWFSFSNLPSTLTELTIESQVGSGNNIQAIEINGEIIEDSEEVLITSIDANATPDPTITVDSGKWLGGDNSFVPNDQFIYRTYTVDTGYDMSNIMSEEICDGVGSPGVAGVNTLTFDQPIPVSSQVELLVYGDSSSNSPSQNVAYGINGNLQASGSLVGGTVPECSALMNVAWLNYGNPGTLNNVVVRYGSQSGAIWAIRVDGKIVAAPNGQTEISKTLNYATKLTLAGDTDLAQMALGPAVMTDGVLGGAGYSQTPYTLTTTEIESVSVFDYGTGWVNAAYPTRSWDGSINTYMSWGTARDTPSVWTGSLPIDGTVRVYVAKNGPGIPPFTLSDSNGNTVSIGSSVPRDTPAWVTVTGLSGNLTEISLTAVTNSVTPRLYAVEINGIIITDGPTTLTFPGDVSTNPDLRYFKAGDLVNNYWNQSQVWSAGVTATTAFATNNPRENGFDGVSASRCTNTARTSGQSSITITFNPPVIVNQKIEIVGGHGSGDRAYATVDGVDSDVLTLTTNNVGTEEYQTLFTGSGVLTKIMVYDAVISSSSNQCGFSSIKIDGRLLVDQGISPGGTVISTDLAANTMTVKGGKWSVRDNDQVWSSYGTGTPYDTSRDWDKAFNGLINTTSSVAAFAAANSVMTWTPPAPITVNSEVTLYLYSSDVTRCLVNGAHIKTAPDSYGTPVTYTAAELGGQLTSISINSDASPNGAYLTAISVDGELLVDAGVSDPGARLATFTIPGGTGDIVEIDQDNNVVYLTEGDRAWIPPNNFNGETFALAAGSLDNPPAPDYLDIAFTSMNAGTTPFSGVDATLSSRTWTLETAPDKSGPWTLVDNYEEFDMTASQDGATPWTTGKPVLNQSTWYRVKVTYNSTAAESVESDYHTFKTAV